MANKRKECAQNNCCCCSFSMGKTKKKSEKEIEQPVQGIKKGVSFIYKINIPLRRCLFIYCSSLSLSRSLFHVYFFWCCIWLCALVAIVISFCHFVEALGMDWSVVFVVRITESIVFLFTFMSLHLSVFTHFVCAFVWFIVFLVPFQRETKRGNFLIRCIPFPNRIPIGKPATTTFVHCFFWYALITLTLDRQYGGNFQYWPIRNHCSILISWMCTKLFRVASQKFRFLFELFDTF